MPRDTRLDLRTRPGARSTPRKPNSKDRLKKAQLTFYCEPEDYARLKVLSARTGVPQQVYLRVGLAHVLEQRKNGAIRGAVDHARRGAVREVGQSVVARSTWLSDQAISALASMRDASRRSSVTLKKTQQFLTGGAR
jgi:hypothetical protein